MTGTTNPGVLNKMRGKIARREDGAIVLEGNNRITTEQQYAPPIKFTVIAQTDSKNLRLAYAADDLIFNWEVNPDELRIDGGPAGDGKHTDGLGRIPANQWVTIEIKVLADSMMISVDGEQRFFAKGDFSGVYQGLSIWPALGSVVKVKSVVISVPDN
jgi:hypothetical protein